MARRDLGATIALGALTLVVLGAGLLVDPGAESSFDRPKRLVTLVGVAIAVVAAFARPRHVPAGRSLGTMSAPARAALGLLVIAVAGAVIATLLSPRRTVSLDALRTVLLYGLLLPLGAAGVCEGGGGRVLLAAFLGASGLNAVVSILQATGVFQPFALEAVAGRAGTGALVGNEGQLALVAGVAAIAALGLAVLARTRGARIASAAGVALLVGAIVVNRNLTALMTLVTGACVLLAALLRRRAVLPALVILLGLAVSLVAVPPLRERTREMARHARAGEWDDLTSNRLGPWAAALEMTRDRPLTGWGPGTFGAEFIPHRLRAEIRYRTRFVIPVLTSSYGEAHCEYLQAVAELGLPAGLIAVSAAGILLLGLCRTVRRSREPEAILLLAILSAGAVASLTWFPLQRPSSAVPLLLAAGRAWRLVA